MPHRSVSRGFTFLFLHSPSQQIVSYDIKYIPSRQSSITVKKEMASQVVGRAGVWGNSVIDSSCTLGIDLGQGQRNKWIRAKTSHILKRKK